MASRRIISALWFAFFMAIIIYHLLIYMLRPQVEEAASQIPALIGLVLLFLGIFSLLVVVNLDLFMLSRPATIRISASQLPKGTAEKSEEDILATAKAVWFQVRFIILCAVAETPGIFALVLAMMGGDMLIVNLLMGLAYISILYAGFRLATSWRRIYLG